MQRENWIKGLVGVLQCENFNLPKGALLHTPEQREKDAFVGGSRGNKSAGRVVNRTRNEYFDHNSRLEHISLLLICRKSFFFVTRIWNSRAAPFHSFRLWLACLRPCAACARATKIGHSSQKYYTSFCWFITHIKFVLGLLSTPVSLPHEKICRWGEKRKSVCVSRIQDMKFEMPHLREKNSRH